MKLNCLLTIGLLLALSVIAGTTVAGTSEPIPPAAKIILQVDTMFGQERIDNYYWLRERENPEVLAYLKAENAYTDTVMEHAVPLQAKIYAELKGRIKETDLSVPAKDGDFFYYYREEEGKQYKIYCRKKGSLEASEEILLDMNVLAEGRDFLSLGTYELSPDHSILAYSLDEVGAERYVMQFLNLETGEISPESIGNTSGDLAWANDNKTVFYTVPDSTWRPFQLYRHTLGSDPAEDQLVYQENDGMFWMGVYKTKSDAYVVLEMGSGLTSESRVLDANNPQGAFQMVRPRQFGIEYDLDHRDDLFYIRTNEKAVNFKLVTAPIDNPGAENWTELIAHRDEVMINGLDLFANFMIIYERENGLRTIRITDFASGESHNMTFPEPVYSYYQSSNPDFQTALLRYTYVSMVTPNSVYDYNVKSRERELKKQKEVLGGYDQSAYESERLFATADDGTKVPISIVYKKGLIRDGSNPTMLYGYGSYGSSMDPWFSTNRPSLLDRGFIFAVAHVRGGGEMGRRWYDDGKLLKKKNTFTDFINCAEYLIAENYTQPNRLTIAGGSAGGLLIGAVINMRPDLFEVAVGAVPFVDVTNTMLDATIPLTVNEYEEWGNPNVEEYYQYINSYSPYDNIKPMPYPHLLILSSLNDTRVQYWEGTKWAAKMRAFHVGDKRLLLKTNMGAGHGGSSGRYDYLDELAFEYTFILDCLGITE